MLIKDGWIVYGTTRNENKIELLEGLHDESPISKFISKRGEGVHHIAMDVKDIHTEIERLKKEGFRMINEYPLIPDLERLEALIADKLTSEGVTPA